MVTLFGFGVLFTIYFWKQFYTFYISPDEPLFFDTDSLKEKIITILFGIFLVGVGPMMMYYGYTVTTQQLNHTIDNGDGSLTIIEYSMSGDSVVFTSKTPVVSKGVVVKKWHGVRVIVKNFTQDTKITVQTEDGRTFTKDYSQRDISVGVGDSVIVTETFYPDYVVSFNF